MDWRKFYDKASDWILTVGPKILVGVIVVIVGLWLIRLVKKWLNQHLFRKDITSSVRPFIVNLVITTLQVLLVLAFMQIVGVQMTAFAAILGAFGVAAGLAISGTLQNFTSGVLILLLKPFRAGDSTLPRDRKALLKPSRSFSPS